MRKLLDHQIKALDWASSRDALAFFMSMRLGKSLTAIRWAQQRSGPYLIICPKSVIPVWQDELAAESHHAMVLWPRPEELPPLNRATWAVTNYESLLMPNPIAFPSQRGKRKRKRKVASSIARYPWPTVIVDESSRMRNPTTKASVILNRYLKTASRRAILTGLPNPESPLDLYQQAHFVQGELLGMRNYWSFRERHFYQAGYQWLPKDGTLERLADAVGQFAFVLTKDDVGMANEHVTEFRYVELPPGIRQIYNKAEEEYVLGTRQTNYTIVSHIWLSQIAGGCAAPDAQHAAKLQELMDLAKGELAEEQLIVWYRFNPEGEQIHFVLDSLEGGAALIRGATPPRRRRDACSRFNDRKLRSLVIQLECGKFGLDLRAADTNIYFSLPPSHEQYAQSRERIENPNKKAVLLDLCLVAKGTIDEHIAKLLFRKRQQSTNFIAEVKASIKEAWHANQTARKRHC